MIARVTRSVAGVVGTCVLIAGPAAPRLAGAQARVRTVHLTVVDKTGAPVMDLAPAELEVKEGGRTVKVVGVKAATTPIRIALLVADGGTGAFQLGVAYFIQDLLEHHAEFAIYSILVQPEKYVDYTKDPALLKPGISRLGVRARSRTGGQLMEAIMDASSEVRGEADRSAIVVMRVGGENPTTMRAEDIRKELIRHGTTLYVVSTIGAQRAAPSQIGGSDPISVQRGQLADAELAEGAFNLQIVLGDGSKETGGRHEQVVSTTLVTVMRQIAKELRSQYEVSYELPEGVRPSDKLSVTSRRKDTRVLAPTRLPTE